MTRVIMGDMFQGKFWQFIRIIRPRFLLLTTLVYVLGVVIAQYLGYRINWAIFFWGLIWVFNVQMCGFFLHEYGISLESQSHNPSKDNDEKFSQLWLQIAFVLTASIAGMITVGLMRWGIVGLPEGIMMLIVFGGMLLVSIPSVGLMDKGYGELVISVLVSNFIPALAFLLQTSDLHKLLLLVTFPLTFMFLAMLIVMEFRSYASDIKKGRVTLLVRIGWERGVLLHNILILTAYLVIGLAALLGVSKRVILMGMLTFPMGLFQIWYLLKIADGIKPAWKFFVDNSMLLYGMLVSILAFQFWIY